MLGKVTVIAFHRVKPGKEEESKDDLDAHLASPHIDGFRAIASDLLAEPPDITLWSEATP